MRKFHESLLIISNIFKKFKKSFKILKIHNVILNILNSYFINPLKFKLQKLLKDIGFYIKIIFLNPNILHPKKT